MKITIGNKTIEIMSLSKADDMLIIQTTENVNPYEVAPLFFENDTITYMYKDEVVETFEGKFTLNHFEQREGIVIYYVSLPSPLEKAEKRIKELSDALTNVELALCEIYESMEV